MTFHSSLVKNQLQSQKTAKVWNTSVLYSLQVASPVFSLIGSSILGIYIIDRLQTQ